VKAMKTVKLITLTLKNFKGVPLFEFNPDGKNATIRGQNRKGKTSIGDGFRDLLFGKNMKGETDFARQPLDERGQKIHHLETLEEAVITIDGMEVRLKRVFKETWLKKKGLLTGHTTDYWIDGVGVQKKRWDRWMSDLINEEIFKIVTLPGYFNSKNLKDKEDKNKAPWRVRRDILFNLPPDKVSDEDIINSDPKLVSLPEILGSRSVDDQKKALKASIKLTEARRDRIEPGIEELIKTIDLGFEAKNLPAIEAYIKHIDAKIEKVRDNTELAGYRKQLANAQVKLSEAQADIRVAAYDEEQKSAGKVFKLKSEIRGFNREIGESQIDIDTWGKTIKENEESMAGLRISFTQEAAKSPQYDEICPTCSQPLPKDQIEATRARFASLQAETLTDINQKGKELKADCDDHKILIRETTHSMNNSKQSVTGLEMNLKGLEKDSEVVAPKYPKHIEKLQSDILVLQSRIEAGPKSDTTELEAERREEQKKLAALDAAEKTKDRIEELKQEEKNLSATIEGMESQLSLMNRFIVTKAHALEDKINACFELVHWKLFNILVNGEVEECCIPMVDGSTELSNSEKINVGLDAIQTLSRHYNFWGPVWIDEAQGITAPMAIESQIFRLLVDKDCPHMEVEID